MRRLRRIIFRGLTVLSLVLFVATMVLWVRSYWISDSVTMRTGWTKSDFGFSTGKISVEVSTYDETVPRGEVSLTYEHDDPWDRTNTTWGGFGYHASAIRGGGMVIPTEVLVVPCWLLAVIFALLPLLWWQRWRQTLYRDGYCPVCGYDLRATPERCPECGERVAVKQIGTAS